MTQGSGATEKIVEDEGEGVGEAPQRDARDGRLTPTAKYKVKEMEPK